MKEKNSGTDSEGKDASYAIARTKHIITRRADPTGDMRYADAALPVTPFTRRVCALKLKERRLNFPKEFAMADTAELDVAPDTIEATLNYIVDDGYKDWGAIHAFFLAAHRGR